MLSFCVAVAVGYCVGSVPMAYWLVRWKSSIDIRQAGSGNVGTLNSYLVTGSVAVGGVVLLLDVLKGAVAVCLVRWLEPGSFPLASVGGVAAVIGHNFPVWLAFKGGRGLATSAGATLVLAWPIIGVWLVSWGAGYLLTRQVNPANAVASALVLVACLVVPDTYMSSIVQGSDPTGWVRLFGVVLMTVILIRHIQPLKEYVEELRGRSGPARPNDGGSS